MEVPPGRLDVYNAATVAPSIGEAPPGVVSSAKATAGLMIEDLGLARRAEAAE